MKETIELGSAPVGEDCAQVGSDDYYERAPKECARYKQQLMKQYEAEHGQPLPEGAKLITKSNSHDFGTYYEVAIKFDEADEQAAEAAYWLESNLPEHWTK